MIGKILIWILIIAATIIVVLISYAEIGIWHLNKREKKIVAAQKEFQELLKNDKLAQEILAIAVKHFL